MYVVKKKQKENKNKQAKRKIKKILYDSLVLYLTKKNG